MESYAVLGMALAVAVYGADFDDLDKSLKKILKAQKIDESISLPTKLYPRNKDEVIACPMCKINISGGLERFRKEGRGDTWQPAWRSSKKTEGDDSSMQLMHARPLIEREIRHNAKNVRYGHRWCNVAMTDHSVEETVDFMEFVVRAHNR